MDLRGQERISTPSCFVCRWQGRHIVIWPQEPLREPERIPMEFDFVGMGGRRTVPPPTYTSGTWEVYNNVHERIQGLRSGFCQIEACGPHWFLIHANWIEIAHEEVQLDRAWNRYVERMEQ